MCWPPHVLFGTFTFFDWLCREATLSTTVDKGKEMTKKKTVLAVTLSEFAVIQGRVAVEIEKALRSVFSCLMPTKEGHSITRLFYVNGGGLVS